MTLTKIMHVSHINLLRTSYAFTLICAAVEVRAAQRKVKLLADTGYICFPNH